MGVRLTRPDKPDHGEGGSYGRRRPYCGPVVTTGPRTSGAPPLPPGRDVDIAGRGTAWVWEAPGPPGAATLLLLHGWTSTAALNWYTSLPALSERYRVVAMDLRGHGRGIRPQDRFRLADCADDAAALCTQMGLGPVVAVGYSMGGAVAQLLWQRHRSQLEGLVLCATAGLFGSSAALHPAVRTVASGVARTLRALPPATHAGLFHRLMARRAASSAFPDWGASERRPTDLGCLIEAGLELNDWDGASVLASVEVPTAVVKTTRDVVVPPWRQQMMADSIPGARVFPVEAGHAVCVENPRLFVPTLLSACRAVTI